MDHSTAPETSRHDELESTPFLAPDPLDNEATATEADEGAQIAPPKTAKSLKWPLVASALSLALGIITLGFNIATDVMLYNGYFNDWPVRAFLGDVRGVAITAVIWAALNIFRLKTRKKALPLILNIIIHIALVFYTFRAALTGLNHWGNRYNTCSYRDMRCQKWLFHYTIVLLIYQVFTALLGIHHALLLVLDLVSAYRCRSRLGSKLCGWVFPTGQMSVQLTVRLLRQENGTNSSAAEGELLGDLA